jgi:hypothetical protein
MRKFWLVAPVLGFAATLALLQWIAGMPVTWLWLHTILVAVAVAAVVRLIPWDRWLFRLRPNSFLYEASLFVLFVRHFAFLYYAEARRQLIAWRIAVPLRFGPGWRRSLKFALLAFFSRTLARTERFYASLLVRGTSR